MGGSRRVLELLLCVPARSAPRPGSGCERCAPPPETDGYWTMPIADQQGIVINPAHSPNIQGLSAGQALRGLITASSELMRSGLHEMLSRLPGVAHVQECADLRAALAVVEQERIDFVVAAPPVAADEFQSLCQGVARSRAKTLVVLRDYDLPPADVVTQAVALPADGYVLESELTAASLDDALARVCRGEAPIPAVLAQGLLSRLRSVESEPIRRQFLLTPRELDVLALLVEGLSNKDIARRLGMSEHGVKRHVGAVLAKLNCPNRTVAVAFVLQKGLVDVR
jgi:two-component system, NarL family, nitrate/nitrite response regulator NarL